MAVDGFGIASVIVRPVLDGFGRRYRERADVDVPVRQTWVAAVGRVADRRDPVGCVSCRKADRDRPVVVARVAGAAVAGDGTRRGGRVDLNELAVDGLSVACIVVRPVLDGGCSGERSGVHSSIRQAGVTAVGRVDDLGDARASQVVSCRQLDEHRTREVLRAARLAVIVVTGDGASGRGSVWRRGIVVQPEVIHRD